MPRFYFKIAVQLNSEGVPTHTGSRTNFLCLGEPVLIHQVAMSRAQTKLTLER
jgi:hypothetical protein